MAGSRKPGSLGVNPEVAELNDGTMIRGLSPRPGPVGAMVASTVCVDGKPPVTSSPTLSRKSNGVNRQMLRQGGRGPEVQKLQRQLNTRLTPSPQLAVDGVFGSLTHQALLQYQQGASIDADGIARQQTWYSLLKGDKVTLAQASLPTSKSPTADPTYSAATAPAPVAGIWEWPLEDKFAEALRRTAPRLPGSMRKEFEALLSPTSLAIIGGTLVVWAGSHAFGVGEVVDLILLIGGAFFLGMAVFDVARELGDFLVVTSNAADERDLDEAADHLARAIAIIGVAAFIALLAKVARGRGGASSTETAGTPKAAEPASSPSTGARPAPSTPAETTSPATKAPPASENVPRKDSYILDREGVPIGARQGLAKPGLPAETLSKEGWPNLPGSETRNFNSAEPVTLAPGKKIYRIIDDSSNPAGGYWSESLPANRAEWRGNYAVKTDWNTNGKYVEYTVPEGPGLNVWRGETSAQQLQGSNFYLPGGGQQIWMPPNTVSPSLAKPTGW